MFIASIILIIVYTHVRALGFMLHSFTTSIPNFFLLMILEFHHNTDCHNLIIFR